jgi:hypothetical protein
MQRVADVTTQMQDSINQKASFDEMRNIVDSKVDAEVVR